jgi:hypothetical protein
MKVFDLNIGICVTISRSCSTKTGAKKSDVHNTKKGAIAKQDKAR